MRIAKLLGLLLVGLMLIGAGCSQQQVNQSKLVSYKTCIVPVEKAEEAPLPKIAKIKEIVYFDFDKKIVRAG